MTPAMNKVLNHLYMEDVKFSLEYESPKITVMIQFGFGDRFYIIEICNTPNENELTIQLDKNRISTLTPERVIEKFESIRSILEE